MDETRTAPIGHSHVFLGVGNEGKEHKIWTVIWLTCAMMIIEIIGGLMFNSLALLADGVHMSTHAAALLIAALAYRYARRHANNPRFAFGTGKLGDLAGYSSALILGVIAVAIGYEAVARLFAPVTINFDEAIAIAILGLLVNIASAWLLSGTDAGHSHGHGHTHGHSHGHSHDHGHAHSDHDHERHIRRLDTGHGILLVELFDEGVPARFRLRFKDQRGFQPVPGGPGVTLYLDRPNGAREVFTFRQFDGFIESEQEIAEPHEFTVRVRLSHDDHAHDFTTSFAEQGHEAESADHGHGAHRDHNYRAAFVHIVADAAVSVLAILGLALGKFLGWTFMDPVMGIVGALVIANWGYTLVRDTGAILLDMTADQNLADQLKNAVEKEGDQLADLHVWRLGPGHLGAILSIVSSRPSAAEYYRCRFGNFPTLSHVTIEVRPQ